MRRVLALAVMTAMLMSGTTVANEDDVKVDVQTAGVTIVVDKDGEVQVEKFGDIEVGNIEVLKGLPKEVQEKIKKALEAHKGAKGIFIGPDGKKHELGKFDHKKMLEGMPKEVREKMEEAMKTHGRKGTFDHKKMFEGMPKEAREKMEEAMKKHGGKGTFDHKKMLEGMPKEVREKIEEAMKKHGGNGIWGSISGFQHIDGAKCEAKATIIGPDGKKHEIDLGNSGNFDTEKMFEGLPEEVREKLEKAMKSHGKMPGFGGSGSVTAKAIIIGPNGKPKEINLGDGNLDDAILKDLPKEIQDAIKGLKIGNSTTFHRMIQRDSEPTNKKILEKLEQLQKQIDELRKQLDK